MALIGNNADTLLHGLSDFWHRFFRDIKDLQAAYEGTEILLGQVYLNLLSDVLNTSVVEAPLFRKEYYKLITVREDQLVFKEHGNDIAAPSVPAFYGNPGLDRYVHTSDTFFGAIPRLQDVIYAPKTALEEGPDYRVKGAEIQFMIDPTDPLLPGYANRRVVVGIGGKFTSVNVADWGAAGVEKGDTLYYSERIDFNGIGAPPTINDAWILSPTNAGARKATIVHVDGKHLSVSSDTPFPTFPAGTAPTGFSWRIVRQRDDGLYNQDLPVAPDPMGPTFTDGQIVYASTLEVNEVSFWAVDAKVDDLTLYNTYGHFFTNKQLSTETYRTLLRGLMQLYIFGPAMARLESALQLTAGLPAIVREGEILQGYDSGILASGTTGTLLANNVFQASAAVFATNSPGGYVKISGSDYATNLGIFNITAYISPTQVTIKPVTVFTLPGLLDPPDPLVWQYTGGLYQTVTTDQGVYEYPLDVPVLPAVKNPANYGVLTFQAFEPLTSAIRVTDYVQDPEWWHHLTIPQELMPDTPAARRVITPQLYPNTLGGTGNAMIGDPGFYIGADEELNPALSPGQALYRHNAAFILMDRFLKLHMFGVLVDESIVLTWTLITDMKKILNDVKPVHTMLYFSPLSTFTDSIDLTDPPLGVAMLRKRLERLGVVDNALYLGSTWNIGDTWKFTGAVGGLVTPNPGAGGVFVAIGGTDPSIQPVDPTNIPPATEPPYIGDISYPVEARIIDRPLYAVAVPFP
jgi:hypothetical protein